MTSAELLDKKIGSMPFPVDYPRRSDIIEAMQDFGNQRYNAALSEAIEQLDKSGLGRFSISTIRNLLEGLKK